MHHEQIIPSHCGGIFLFAQCCSLLILLFQNKAMKVLAISSSRVGGGGFLENAVPLVSNFIGDKNLNINKDLVANDCRSELPMVLRSVETTAQSGL